MQQNQNRFALLPDDGAQGSQAGDSSSEPAGPRYDTSSLSRSTSISTLTPTPTPTCVPSSMHPKQSPATPHTSEVPPAFTGPTSQAACGGRNAGGGGALRGGGVVRGGGAIRGKQWSSNSAPAPRRRAPPRIFDDNEQDAQALWRQRRDPALIVDIPTEIAHRDKGFVGIANQHSTFIHCSDPSSRAPILKFGIWGTAENAAAAKREIRAWMDARTTSETQQRAKTSTFTKVASLTDPLREREERRWKREVRRERYRQYPPEGMAFAAIGTFHWPSNDYRAEDILGTSYQALDPIRMDCSCYVAFLKDRSLFQVSGDAKDVRTALRRIRNVCFQIAARQVSPVRACMLYWTWDEISSPEIPSHVYLGELDGPRLVKDARLADKSLGMQPCPEGTLQDQEKIRTAISSSQLNVERVRATIANALRKIHFYQGHLRLRIRLGSCLLRSYFNPPDGLYDLQEYTDMLGEAEFRATVTEDFGRCDELSHILPTVQNSDDLFTTASIDSVGLAEEVPIYSATFTFIDGNSELRLHMDWMEATNETDGVKTLTIAHHRWLRSDGDQGRASALVELALSNLQTGRAWAFELDAAQPVENSRLPADLAGFVERVKADAAVVQGRNFPASGKTFVTYPLHPKLRVVRSALHYRYVLSGTDYTFELSQHQDRRYAEYEATAPLRQPDVYEPCWNLSVYRLEWNAMFIRNERLAVGEQAEWDDSMDTWFPADAGTVDEDGFAQLWVRLVNIEKLLEPPCDDSEDEEEQEDWGEDEA